MPQDIKSTILTLRRLVVVMQDSLAKLHKVLPKEVLPGLLLKEAGDLASIETLASLMKNRLADVRKIIDRLD